jgi:hypothetical protein
MNQVSNFIIYLKDPLFAFKIILIVASFFGYSFCRKGVKIRESSVEDANNFWKILTMVAEIFVLGGLLGLATFAGREKNNYDNYLLQKSTFDAEAATTKEINKISYFYCSNIRNDIQKNEFRSEAVVFCDTIKNEGRNSDGSVIGEERKIRLRRYISDHLAPTEKTLAAREVLRLIEDFEEKIIKSNLSQESFLDRYYKSAWKLILVAFLLASIGVGIKISKAVYEALPALRKYRGLEVFIKILGWVFLGWLLSIFWIRLPLVQASIVFSIAIIGTSLWSKKFGGYKFCLIDYYIVIFSFTAGSLIQFVLS